MKIAKKLLAAVVAVMLVLSLSVCAFAAQSAETGDVKIESDWVIDSWGTIAVKVYFTDAVDLKSWDLKLNYDADMFDFDMKEVGADAKAVQTYCDSTKNSFTDESNPNSDGEIKVGGYFKEVLWTAEDFLAASTRAGDCIVNDEKFEASIFYLKVVDTEGFEKNGTTITISGGMTFAAAKEVSDSITKEGEATEPSTEPTEPSTEPTEPSTEPTEPSTEPTEPSTEPTEPTEPSTEPTEAPATRPVEDDDDDCKPGKPGHENCKPNKPACKPGKPNQNHPNTGDSAALAAAAGVVLLAGAAFVVSKKRK